VTGVGTSGPADAVHMIEIEAPIERVWSAITNRDGVTPPMFNCVLRSDLEPGSRMDYTDAGGKRCFLFGDVLEIEPPRRLVHTFVFGFYDDAPTRVEWNLEELTAQKTRVTVTHRGLVEGSKTRKDVSGGWPTILRRFKAQIETGSLPFKDRLQLGLMSAFSFMLPKRLLMTNTDKRSASLPTEPVS